MELLNYGLFLFVHTRTLAPFEMLFSFSPYVFYPGRESGRATIRCECDLLDVRATTPTKFLGSQ